MSGVLVSGIGWADAGGHGCVARGERSDAGIDAAAKSGLFAAPFRNFGRLDRASRAAAVAAALALKDAGIPAGDGRKRDIGIIGSGEGSLATDLDYFRDYVDCGRTLARGSLFIYTLPSSPLGEAAIHFGLQGPLLYLADPAAPFGAVLAEAEAMVRSGEAEGMLAGAVATGGAVFAVLTRGTGRWTALQTAAALEHARTYGEAAHELGKAQEKRVSS